MFTLFGILFYLSDVLEKQHHINGVIKGLILAIPLLVMCTTSILQVVNRKKPTGNEKINCFRISVHDDFIWTFDFY